MLISLWVGASPWVTRPAFQLTMTTEYTPSEARSIERMPIDSSAMKSVGYCPSREVLAIEFHSGLVIHYDGVTQEAFEAFAATESRGRAYAASIKGKYPARVMTGLCQRCAKPGYVGEQCEHCKLAPVLPIDRVHKP